MDEQTTTEDVDYSDICKAWRAWRDCCGFNVTAFREFTGWDSTYSSSVLPISSTVVRMTPEQVRRIKLMAGPHGHTLLKAYLASKEPGMRNTVEYAVDDELLNQVARNWKVKIDGGHDITAWWWTDLDRRHFYEYVGITQAQCDEYARVGTLCVSLVTYKKLKVLASGNLEHHKTLFKVIEVLYGKDQL